MIGYEDYAKSLYDFVKKNDLEDSVIFQDQTKKILEEYDKAAFYCYRHVLKDYLWFY